MWTYSNATQFTITGDWTNTYLKGLKIKWADGTISSGYGYVLSSSFGAGVTTVTLIPSTSYILHAGITAQYYSTANPSDFPGWLNYTPAGISNTNVTLTGRFNIVNSTCHVQFKAVFTGAITFTTMPSLPIVASSNIITYGGFIDIRGTGGYVDNGVNLYPMGIMPAVYASNSVFYLCSSPNGTYITATTPITWANLDCIVAQFSYEI